MAKNIRIYYAIAYCPVTSSDPKFLREESYFQEIQPQTVVEVKTIPAENSYIDPKSRTRLAGIALRIFSGKSMVAEWADPKIGFKYWEEDSTQNK
jgi:hypothetical protein